MRKPAIRRGLTVLLALTVVASASFLPLPAKTRTFQVVLHFRQPDGTEKQLEVSDFRFVYYDRRFVHRPTGFGKPGELEIKDLPREVRSLQDEDLDRLKFSKIRSVALEYREEEGKRLLYLVATRTSRRRKPVDFPAQYLRNANMSLLPHFRGMVDGVTTDFPLPPLVDTPAQGEAVLTGIEFQVPGKGPGS